MRWLLLSLLLGGCQMSPWTEETSSDGTWVEESDVGDRLGVYSPESTVGFLGAGGGAGGGGEPGWNKPAGASGGVTVISKNVVDFSSTSPGISSITFARGKGDRDSDPSHTRFPHPLKKGATYRFSGKYTVTNGTIDGLLQIQVTQQVLPASATAVSDNSTIGVGDLGVEKTFSLDFTSVGFKKDSYWEGVMVFVFTTDTTDPRITFSEMSVELLTDSASFTEETSSSGSMTEETSSAGSFTEETSSAGSWTEETS